MRRIVSVLTALCMLLCFAACQDETQSVERDLSYYDAQGYYDLIPADVGLLQYKAAPIMELLLDYEAVTSADVIFEKKGEAYVSASPEDYELRQSSELAVPMYYADAADGTRHYPEQFVRYTLGEKYYYSIGALTVDKGYAASADGKQMVYKGADGLLLLYQAEQDTLSFIGQAQYDGRNAEDYGNGWVADFALSASGRYLAFTSNRRTYTDGKSFDMDLWVRDMQSGEERLLAQAISSYSDLYFVGEQVFYCNHDAQNDEYRFIGIDAATGQQIDVAWDSADAYIANGCIIGKSKIYDIADGRTTEFEASLNGKLSTGVLSGDKSTVAVLYAQDEKLYVLTVNLNDDASILYCLPSEFLENFIDFKLIGMQGNCLYLQCKSRNGDESGNYTFYYQVDLSYILENR